MVSHIQALDEPLSSLLLLLVAQHNAVVHRRMVSISQALI